MRNIQLTLRWKILLVISLACLIFYGVNSSIRIYQIKKDFDEQVNRSGQERAELIANAVANLIVAYDYSNIEALESRIVSFQDIHKINILDRTGKVMATRFSSGINPESERDGNNDNIFVAPVYYDNVKVGSVELFITRGRFDDVLAKNYIDDAIATILSILFFGGIIYAMFSVFVVRPLNRLGKAAEALAKGDYSAELPEQTQDEIGKLIDSFSKMRESRKSAEIRLQAIFDNSPDAFVQLDKNGNIIDWNEKSVSIWGYSKDDILGKNFSVVLPDTNLGLNPGYRKCYQKSESIIGLIREVVGQRKDGSYFPLELRTSEINFEGDNAYLVLARDITARKEGEEKLISAVSAAEAANQAKSTFLSNMSHEIRTPMNSIIGMTTLALKTHLNAKQQDYLTKIDYSANHLLELINDMLDFSKIEANKLELELMDFELGAIFKNLSSQLSHSAAEKSLRLDFDLDAGLSKVLRGDSMRITQILLNYIVNAIKFTEKGKIVVRGKLLEDGDKDVLVRFEVEDQGIGLSEQEINNLFIPFSQSDVSTTRKYGGTGLGLAICKQLSELMGGRVGVESKPQEGSTFWFVVRLMRGERSNLNVASEAHVDVTLLKGTTVLVVDDNVFNQQVAAELLEDVGVIVSIASNGREAIEKLLERRFDCVLMDVQMPVMDGMEATRLIRANPALSKICIVATTANARKEDKERCLAAGMDHFVTKPIFANALYATILQCIDGALAVDKQQAEIAISNDLVPGDKFKALHVDRDPLVDLTVLKKMLGADPVKVSKFARKFVLSARQGLDEIEQVLGQGDLIGLAALGHRNKTPARTVGAFAYAELCQSLEQFKDGDSIERARSIVSQMQILIEQIAVQIERETVAH